MSVARNGGEVKTMRKGFGFGLVALLATLALSASIVRGPSPYHARIARRVADFMPRYHVTRMALDETVSARAWTNYLETLDAGRVYFLRSDIDRFETVKRSLGEALSRGETQFAYDVFETFLARVRDRKEFVARQVEKGFDFERDESLAWQRKDAPWVRDRAEWDELWRQRVKNDYLRRLLMAETADDPEPETAEEPPGPSADRDAPAPPPQTPPQTPAPDAVPAAELDEDANLSPAEFVVRPYRRYLDMLQDSDGEWVLERYLSAFTGAFDPHSEYMSQASVEDFEIQMKLSLVGIGALLRSEEGAAQVIRLLPGGPASRDERDLRLQPGDKIIAVGQGSEPPIDVLHWPLNKVVRLIRGKKGTRVMLVCIAAADPTGSTIKRVDLVRDEVQLEEQAARLDISAATGSDGRERKIGVLRLPSFYADMAQSSRNRSDARSAAADMRKLIGEAMEQKVEGLILDLRNNGGGALPEAIAVTGLFVGNGPVVQVGGLDGVNVMAVQDMPNPLYPGPLVVLVSRVSASASEIVAGALQDYGRAIVVGDSKTHGKGTVQTVARLGLDAKLGKLKVTAWKYYRVTGESVQLKGVTPDIVLPSAFDFMEMGEDHHPYAIAWSTIEKTRFQPVKDLRPVIARLAERSAERRAAGESYRAYLKLLNRMREQNRKTHISLNLQDRKKTMASEREFAKAQSELMAGALGEDRKNDSARDDVVLREALNIAADFAALPAP